MENWLTYSPFFLISIFAALVIRIGILNIRFSKGHRSRISYWALCPYRANKVEDKAFEAGWRRIRMAWAKSLLVWIVSLVLWMVTTLIIGAASV